MDNLCSWSLKCCFFGKAIPPKGQNHFLCPPDVAYHRRVSLAIDTKECDAAAAMLKTYLHSVAVTDTTPQQYAPRTPSKAQPTSRHLSKAQYAAGARLYALEVAIHLVFWMLPVLVHSHLCHAYLYSFAWQQAHTGSSMYGVFICDRCLQKGWVG